MPVHTHGVNHVVSGWPGLVCALQYLAGMKIPTADLARIGAAGALAFLIGCSSQNLPDTDDAGGAADTGGTQADALVVGGCRLGKPLLSQPCFTCAPLPADSHNLGCGGPLPMLWGWDGRGIASGVVYPLECMVYLPVENPYYPGGPQACSCTQLGDQPPQWLCGI